jgi:hypothetical protein
MDLQRAHDGIRPTRRIKRVLSSELRQAASKQSVSREQSKLEKLLRELADVIEAEHGILTL